MQCKMTDIVDRLKAYAEINESFSTYTEAKCALDAATEIVRLRSALERILLDVKFMTEKDVVPAHILDDFIYQEALSLMSDDFLKEFNND